MVQRLLITSMQQFAIKRSHFEMKLLRHQEVLAGCYGGGKEGGGSVCPTKPGVI